MWWVPIAAAAAEGASKGLTQQSAAPSQVISEPVTNSWLDGSGWTVATSGSSAKGGDRDQSTAEPFNPLVIASLVLGAVAWKVFSK
jgi:hypothetical protein